MAERFDGVLVIGAGPAGLMAAETLVAAGVQVRVLEAKASPARKFLMAGKSGLNLTKDEQLAVFTARYDSDWLAPLLADFGPEQVRKWAEGLGAALFTGSTGRVFPVAMKASPLLRAWLARLDAAGVDLRRRWRWTGLDGDAHVFDTPEGSRRICPLATVLALGGASWSRLGSDAAWVPWLTGKGVEITPFAASNVGLRVAWSPHMTTHFGQPVKGIALFADGQSSRGELVISAAGLEGGGIYALSATLRDGAALTIDLLPDRGVDNLTGALTRRGKDSLANHLRKALRLSPAKIALLQEWGRPLPADPRALATLLKTLPVRHQGPRPMDEAISTAGGIAHTALTEALELRAVPGVFACGEMLDWDAPTGGYLLTACLATGRHAGAAAAAFVKNR
ncbi:MAG: TIGR03862 family flavoprotein [Paracoccaceae bacterium]